MSTVTRRASGRVAIRRVARLVSCGLEHDLREFTGLGADGRRRQDRRRGSLGHALRLTLHALAYLAGVLLCRHTRLARLLESLVLGCQGLADLG
jgi:hypothetical protein